jgi:hypothetical protein
VITRHGTLVGPLMAELAGFPEFTPYGVGSCENDVSPTCGDPGRAHRHHRLAGLDAAEAGGVAPPASAGFG